MREHRLDDIQSEKTETEQENSKRLMKQEMCFALDFIVSRLEGSGYPYNDAVEQAISLIKLAKEAVKKAS